MTFLEMRADEPPFLNQEHFCFPRAQPEHCCKVKLPASRTETSHRTACPTCPSDPFPFHRGCWRTHKRFLAFSLGSSQLYFCLVSGLALGVRGKARRCFLPCFGLGNISKRTQKRLSVIIPASTASRHQAFSRGTSVLHPDMKEAGLEGKALPPTSASFQVTQAFSASTHEQDLEGEEGKEVRCSNSGRRGHQ